MICFASSSLSLYHLASMEGVFCYCPSAHHFHVKTRGSKRMVIRKANVETRRARPSWKVTLWMTRQCFEVFVAGDQVQVVLKPTRFRSSRLLSLKSSAGRCSFPWVRRPYLR